jgi:hypothetical protein
MTTNPEPPAVVSDRDPRSERGFALIVATMATLLMMALGTALILMTTTEAKIARNYGNSLESLYAADAAAERAVDDLASIPDWNSLLAGISTSAFVDGPPSGIRTLADGTMLDLGEALNMANCSKATACSAADLDAVTAERPWGPNNPRWQLFAYNKLSDMTPTGTINSPFYITVMVGDDPSENDNDPLHDGVAANPGTGVLAIRAEAWGPHGSHKAIELTVARAGTSQPDGGGPPVPGQGLRVLSWREIRQVISP